MLTINEAQVIALKADNKVTLQNTYNTNKPVVAAPVVSAPPEAGPSTIEAPAAPPAGPTNADVIAEQFAVPTPPPAPVVAAAPTPPEAPVVVAPPVETILPEAPSAASLVNNDFAVPTPPPASTELSTPPSSDLVGPIANAEAAKKALTNIREIVTNAEELEKTIILLFPEKDVAAPEVTAAPVNELAVPNAPGEVIPFPEPAPQQAVEENIFDLKVA